MSHSGLEASKATSSPQRPRHQITRSISELSSPIRLHRQHSHRAAKERERDAAALSPVASQTATPSNTQGRLSLDGPPSGAVTPNLSPNPSRRTSILFLSSGDNTYNPLLPCMGPSGPPTNTAAGGNGLAMAPIVPPGNPASTTLNNTGKSSTKQDDPTTTQQQKAAAAREISTTLSTTLTYLTTFQLTSTRRFDSTYHSVLTRLSTLQATILGLKQLASLSRDMSHTFSTDASDLVADTSAQLDAFGQFEDQARRIDTLQGRVHVGRDKIRVLSERVDRVRERIERWERADREWQERTRRRLRIGWVVSLVVVFLVGVVVVGAQYYAPVGGQGAGGLEEVTGRVVGDGLGVVRNVTAGGKDILWGGSGSEKGKDGEGTDEGESSSSGGSLVLPSPSSSSADEDLLRVFDEL